MKMMHTDENITSLTEGISPVPLSPSKHNIERVAQGTGQGSTVQAMVRPNHLDSKDMPTRSGIQQLATKALKLLPSAFFSLVSLFLLIGIWHLATKFRIDWYIRFNNIPTPGDVMTELNILSRENAFYTNMWLSMCRIVLGFSIATVLGIVLGLLIGRYKRIGQLVFPACEVLRPIPAIAWVPMSIMLWPTNEASIIFITFIGSFFPILLNTIHGVRSVDPVLVRAACSLGAGEFSVLRHVILYGALPHIFTGLSVGMGVAWVSLIAAEMISGQYGIGYFTWEAYSLVQYPHIVIGMILIGVLGLFCSGVIHMIGNLMMPWMKLHNRGAH